MDAVSERPDSPDALLCEADAEPDAEEADADVDADADAEAGEATDGGGIWVANVGNLRGKGAFGGIEPAVAVDADKAPDKEAVVVVAVEALDKYD